ncbi:class I SAM-dependent methyltransferase [Desulfocicer niacini]
MKRESKIDNDSLLSEDIALENWYRDYFLPLDVEIGFGGTPLICQLAKYQYNRKFVGIEKLKHFCLRAERYVEEHSIRNVKIINSEAYEYICQHIPSNRVDTVHVYFPSPGPSAQRLFSKDFVNQIYRIVKLGGQLRLLSDDENYFKSIYMLFNNTLWQHINWCRFNLDLPDCSLVGTDCENKYGSKYALQLIKL